MGHWCWAAPTPEVQPEERVCGGRDAAAQRLSARRCVLLTLSAERRSILRPLAAEGEGAALLVQLIFFNSLHKGGILSGALHALNVCNYITLHMLKRPPGTPAERIPFLL